jgi:hypothetical protein
MEQSHNILTRCQSPTEESFFAGSLRSINREIVLMRWPGAEQHNPPEQNKIQSFTGDLHYCEVTVTTHKA